MTLTEEKIKQAQEIVEAVMSECDLMGINFSAAYGVMLVTKRWSDIEGDDLATLYINRLHELAGTTPPPF